MSLCMFGRKSKQTPKVKAETPVVETDDDDGVGLVDGGEGRGVPLGGHDERPPTGYRSGNEEEDEFGEILWDDGDPADRRKDPLRRP